MTKRARKFKTKKKVVGDLAFQSSSAPIADSVLERLTAEDRNASKLWIGSSLVIVAIAALLRLYWLGLKPFHQDEGVNGVFLQTLLRDGVYKYDPSNYHGPTLYFFALASSYLFGLNDFAVRFVTVVFGILTVVLVLNLRRYIGTIGSLVAGLLVALSPGLSFISRYFIHEILFLFFTFAVVVCVLKFIENEPPGRIVVGTTALSLFVCLLPGAVLLAPLLSRGDAEKLFVARFLLVVIAVVCAGLITQLLLRWNEGRPIYLLLASGSVMMTFATKETAFISFGTMIIALGCLWVWTRLLKVETSESKIRRIAFLALHFAFLLIAVYFRKDLWNGILWFYNDYFVNVENKEQPLVLVAIIILFVGSVAVWIKYLIDNWRQSGFQSTIDEPTILNYQTFAARFGNSKQSIVLTILCLVIFVYVGVLFFSSFFTYREGVQAGFEAYNIWTKTGTKDHTQNGVWAYLKWLLAAEVPLFILGALGSLIAFWQAKHRFAMFAALWGFGLFIAYTVIPYKTPWLAINFVLPMGIAAGYGINELIIGGKQIWQRPAAIFLTLLGVGICTYQTIELNFVRYDDDSRPYIYAHTRRSMDEMVRVIRQATTRAGTGNNASIIIASPEHWPLAWSLREYKYPGFFGSAIDSPNAEIIIGSKTQTSELEKKYSGTHQFVGTYSLRPGVDLLLYVRKDLASKR